MAMITCIVTGTKYTVQIYKSYTRSRNDDSDVMGDTK